MKNRKGHILRDQTIKYKVCDYTPCKQLWWEYLWGLKTPKSTKNRVTKQAEITPSLDHVRIPVVNKELQDVFISDSEENNDIDEFDTFYCDECSCAFEE